MNNFAFGPEVDHQLKERFANMKEGLYTCCAVLFVLLWKWKKEADKPHSSFWVECFCSDGSEQDNAHRYVKRRF